MSAFQTRTEKTWTDSVYNGTLNIKINYGDLYVCVYPYMNVHCGYIFMFHLLTLGTHCINLKIVNTPPVR